MRAERRAGADRGAQLRALAAQVNARVVARGESLDRSLERVALEDTRDLALLRAIAYGTLRWHHRIQWQVTQLLSRPIAARDTDLAALLRVGLFQLQWLRIPEHAAVAATVGAAELLGARRAKGLVNAVLRRFLRERVDLEQRLPGNREAATSHPQWMLELLDRDLPGRTDEIVAANNQAPPMWLRVNERRMTRSHYLDLLAADGIEAQPSDTGSAAVILSEARATAVLPGYEAGLVSVQDGAAQLAAGLLELEPGQRVLDACAAPGGKAAHLLETCPTIGELLALDLDRRRLDVVAENLRRLGLSATLSVADAGDTAAWWDGRPFERILLDAPCSALGVIRRHPDIKVLRRAADIGELAKRQARLLRSLWATLARGGRLVYATCTVTREENRDRIAAFLAATPDAELRMGDDGAGRQILPGEANMDGFYYACLDKR